MSSIRANSGFTRINTGLRFFLANRLDAALKRDTKRAIDTPGYKNETMKLVEKKKQFTEREKSGAILKEQQDEVEMQKVLAMDLKDMADQLVASGEYEIVSTNTRGEKWPGLEQKHMYCPKRKKTDGEGVLASAEEASTSVITGTEDIQAPATINQAASQTGRGEDFEHPIKLD